MLKIIIRTCPLCGQCFDVDTEKEYGTLHFIWCRRCFESRKKGERTPLGIGVSEEKERK